MEFNVINNSDSISDSQKIIYNFLCSINPSQLSYEVANSMSWGDGDPITVALEILKQRVLK